MQSRDTFLAPGIISIDVQVQPILNILNSYRLLAMADIRYGLASWVYETVSQMTPDERHLTRMLFQSVTGLSIVESQQEWSDFEDFLDALSSADPVALMKQDLAAWYDHASTHIENLPTPDQLINDIDTYVTVMQNTGKDDFVLDEAFLRKTHRFLSDPVAMHQITVDHLTTMWKKYLEPEWAHRQAFIEQAVDNLSILNTDPMTLVEAVRLFTGRDITEWMKEDFYASRTHVIFIPSPHMGPYISGYETSDKTKLRLVFGARIIQPREVSSFDTFEVQTRLEALGDAIRLQIVRMIATQSEVSTEDIMEAFDLTKSTASRHLRQLTATGILLERREGGAKKVYTLNQATAHRLIRSLEEILLTGG